MTPIAHALAMDLMQPVKKRRFAKTASIVRPFDDLHCFEMTAVDEAAQSLADAIVSKKPSGKLAFLPAPRTFIETGLPSDVAATNTLGVKRSGILLETREDGQSAAMIPVVALRDGQIGTHGEAFTLPLNAAADGTVWWNKDNWHSTDVEASGAASLAYVYLAMINTPRIILRHSHQPHKGLARAARAASFQPPRPWHEIRLEVRPPDLEPRGHNTNAVETLAGAKALHFVRCHLRFRLGSLELVTAHWRGDPAFGITQTKYAVIPPRRGIWPDLQSDA